MSPLYKKLGVLKFRDLYWFNIATICHEYFYNNEFPEKIKSSFTKKCDMYTISTRATENELYYKCPKLVSTYKKPSVCGSAFWNSLPSKLRESSSLTIFKNNLRAFFIEKY